MGSSCVLAQGSACSFKQAPSMDSKISRLVILSSGDQWPNRGGDPEKNCKKMHSIPPLPARGNGSDIHRQSTFSSSST